MKNHLLLPILVLLPWSAQAAPSFYVEPHASHVHIANTPRLDGESGREFSSDLPSYSASLIAGVKLTPLIGVELRYSELNDIEVRKSYHRLLPPIPAYLFAADQSLSTVGPDALTVVCDPDYSCLPWWMPYYEEGHAPTGPGPFIPGPYIPVAAEYIYTQESKIISLAIPIQVLRYRRLTASLTPILNQERSSITCTRVPLPFELLVAGTSLVLHHEEETTYRPALEASLGFQLHKNLSVTASYTYAPLKAFEVHYASAGLRFEF